MKSLRQILLIAFLFLISQTYAQEIQNEIKSYVDSSELLVNNGRKLLLSSLQKKDYKKAKEIYTYLNSETATKGCVAFNYTENLNITCLLTDWDIFFDIVEEIDSAGYVSLCYPKSFEISHQLYNEVEQNADSILDKASTELPDEKYNLLEIYLYIVKNGYKNETYGKK
ncbi:MAG: hypothetical protein PHH37_09930 [Paludibacter sp.]|nr:hypothetical protein [Paludibacter sp.]